MCLQILYRLICDSGVTLGVLIGYAAFVCCVLHLESRCEEVICVGHFLGGALKQMNTLFPLKKRSVLIGNYSRKYSSIFILRQDLGHAVAILLMLLVRLFSQSRKNKESLIMYVQFLAWWVCDERSWQIRFCTMVGWGLMVLLSFWCLHNHLKMKDKIQNWREDGKNLNGI